MKKIKFILIFLLPCLLIVSCNKGVEEKDIIGKWKPCGVLGLYSDLDVENNNVIYDFQKNNKLIVTTFISGELQKTEYSYKCVKSYYHPWADDFSGRYKRKSRSLELYLDGVFYSWCDPTWYYDEMWIGYLDKGSKVIDETDLLVLEQNHPYDWYKYFKRIN